MDDQAWLCQAVILSHDTPQENPTHLLAKNHLQPRPLSTVPAREYGDHHHQEAMALDWALAAEGCQLCHQSCNPLDPRGKVEVWSTEDNLAKNCGSKNEEYEWQLGHYPEAGQWQTGLEELRCCPIRQLMWQVVMTYAFTYQRCPSWHAILGSSQVKWGNPTFLTSELTGNLCLCSSLQIPCPSQLLQIYCTLNISLAFSGTHINMCHVSCFHMFQIMNDSMCWLDC